MCLTCEVLLSRLRPNDIILMSLLKPDINTIFDFDMKKAQCDIKSDGSFGNYSLRISRWYGLAKWPSGKIGNENFWRHDDGFELKMNSGDGGAYTIFLLLWRRISMEHSDELIAMFQFDFSILIENILDTVFACFKPKE